MEAMREDKTVVKNKEIISIFNLGVTGEQILHKWKEWNTEGIQVSLKEFPAIDLYQTIDNKPLMEVILEFAILMETNKKQLAKQRQAEGIAKARENGIKLGRREKEIPVNFTNVYKGVIAKKISIKKATEMLDVDYKTYRKWVKQYKE